MKLWPETFDLDTGVYTRQAQHWRERLTPKTLIASSIFSFSLLIYILLPSSASKSGGLSPTIQASPARYLDGKDIPDAPSTLLDPIFHTEPNSALEYPPNLQPATMNGYKRASATFVSLVRNGELDGMMSSMREIENAFNKKAQYPWVFLNEEDFTEEFKSGVRRMTRSKITFGKVAKEQWGYPSWIDQDRAAKTRQTMKEQGVFYGDSESYRHMCRFNSGFFYRHPLMKQFDYYWRVEPNVKFFCDIDYDPFLFMQQNNKAYGFTVAVTELKATIETLWSTVQEFFALHPDYLAKDNAMNFVVDDLAKGMQGDYNLCHFWSNFEIGDLRFWRSKEYSDFFDFLDQKGGFFYERWGDAPVHSIAAALLLPKDRIHYFNDIGYQHDSFIHCPTGKAFDNGKCACNPADTYEQYGSCVPQWERVLSQ